MTKNYKLVALTNRADIEICHRNNFEAWGKGLSLPDYLERERNFGNQDMTREGALKYWALLEQQDDHDKDSWIIVSALETVKRPGYYQAKGQPLREVVNFGIGSVFTPEVYRGKGFAKLLLNMLTERLDTTEVSDLPVEDRAKTFSVLWSDIGDYYSQFGYQVCDTKELKVKLADVFSEDKVASLDEMSPKVEILSSKDYDILSTQDREQLLKILVLDVDKDGTPRVAIDPSKEVLDAVYSRAQFLGPLIGKSRKEVPKVLGVRCGESWMLWTHDFTADKLTVLRLFVDLDRSDRNVIAQEVLQMIRAAVKEARQWGFEYFTLWNQDIPHQLSGSELAQELKLKNGIIASFSSRTKEMGSWPMIRPYGGENGGVKWILDGKYGWF